MTIIYRLRQRWKRSTTGNESPAMAGPLEGLYAPEHVASDAGPVRRRLRDVHAEPRFDSDRYSIADYRALARRDPAAPQRRDHLLLAEPRGLHPDQRLDRRPVWGAARLQPGDRGLHLGFDRLRFVHLAASAGCRAYPAGHGRRTDGAGRAAGFAATRPEIRSGAGVVVRRCPGVERPLLGPAARRLHRHLCLLALDLLYQYPDRDIGHRARQHVGRRFEGNRATAAGPDRLCADRYRPRNP